jgi:hypothetical protein
LIVRAKPAHQSGHLRAHWKLAARTGFDEADAFDTAHGSRLRPLAAAHMHLGMVDAKGLDLNDNVICLRLWFGDVVVNEAVEAAEFFENNSAHDNSFRS